MTNVPTLSCLAASLLCVLAAQVHAAEAPTGAPVPAGGTQTAPPAPTDLDRVQVTMTGTRIPRAGFDTLEPAQVISREELDAQNITNLADAMARTPSFGLSASAYGSQSSYGAGVSFASRFGLGSNRLLTLVNGRRFVSSNPPTAFGPGSPGSQVDLNIIPTNLIERVENVGIGGAPTYGSDAISGVSNVILRDHFDGVEVELGYGLSERGDGQRVNASSLFGTAFAEGRGHFVLSLNYDSQDGVLQADRRSYREGYSLQTNPAAKAIAKYQPGRVAANDGRLDASVPFNAGSSDGVPGSVYIRDRTLLGTTWGGVALPVADRYSADASGRLRGFGGNADTYVQFDGQGNLVPYDPGRNFGTGSASGGDGARLWEVSQVVSDLDRKTAYLTGHFDFSERVRGFWEASSYSAQARELTAQSIYNSTSFGQARLDGGGEKDGVLRIPASHPLLTEQARQRLQALGAKEFLLSRASRDLVTGNSASQSDVWRVVGGLEGYFALGDRNFNWQVSGVHGRGDFSYTGRALVQQNFINALNVSRTADGRVVCNGDAAGVTADPACVPLDLFGENRASREALSYVTTPTRASSSMEQTVFNANLTGEVVELPGGMMSFNAGYEFRREEGSFNPSSFEQQGLGRAVAINAAAGKIHSNEFFGELFAPLVDADAGIPGLHRFDVTGKVRWVNNSVNGAFTAFTYGFQYEPLPGVQLRANKTRSFRSPALVELYADQSAFYFVNEPCEAAHITSGPRPANRAANCAAFFSGYPSVDPATFEGPSGSIPGRRVGSTQLRNEQADSWTAGLVLQPEWAKGLRMAVDYYSIDLTDMIGGLSPDNILSGCFDGAGLAGNAYCTLIRRDPVTAMARTVDTTYVNGPYINFRGWTAEATYRFDLDELGWGRGRLDLGLYAYVPRVWEKAAAPGIPPVDYVNTNSGQTRQYQWNASYGVGRWSLGATANYYPSHLVKPNLSVESQDYFRVDGYLGVDANVGYRFNQRWRMNLSVKNLTDNMGHVPHYAGTMGRRYMLTATMKL
ncbi:MAG TPA: TonB-dependent receptor [Stenotrophomonas sp.]